MAERPPFLWGAATSSHQVEGHQHNDWTQWEAEGRTRESSGRAADHWRLWHQDFKLLTQLSLNSYRFSLEWSRIEPAPGQFDQNALAQYRAMVIRLKELHITPLITLHHFTLPLWLAQRGGLYNPDACHWFARYVNTIIQSLGDSVDLYITLNEPMVLVIMGYIMAMWPPGGHGFTRALKLINRLAQIHQTAYHTIKERQPQAQVGLAHHLIAFEPWRPHMADRATANVLHYLMNDRFIKLVGDTQDFIGVNYYTRQYAHWSRGLHPIQNRSRGVLTDMGWEVYPEGLLQVLRRVKHYQKPILITENGISTGNDALRTRYLEDHLNMVGAAQQEGLDVRGYFYWSLLDNFEWAEGFGPRFGLVDVNYETLERKIRPSAYRYRDIIRANSGNPPIIVPSMSQ